MTIQNLAYTGNELTEEVQTANIVTRRVRNMNRQNDSIEFQVEPFDRTAIVHYEGYIRSMFEDAVIVSSESQRMVADMNLQAYIGIYSGNNNTPATYLLIRGVAQYGEVARATAWKVLSTLPKLKRYAGYELTAAFIASADQGDLFHINLGNTVLEEITQSRDHQHWLFDLSNITAEGQLNFDIEETPVGTTTNVEQASAPVHPFYVRWVNNLGGYDYFMFACNHKNTRSLVTSNAYLVPSGNGAQRTYQLEGAEKVEVSSGNVDADTYKALSKIPFSPDIRWYNEAIAQWVPITAETADHEWLEAQPTGEIILSFELPKPQLNR